MSSSFEQAAGKKVSPRPGELLFACNIPLDWDLRPDGRKDLRPNL
jgi:hypothetical protein